MRILVLGDLNLDVIAGAPGALSPGFEARAPIRVVPGGSAGTFARVAAAQGAAVRFVGSVGSDAVGDLLVASLVSAGVEPVVQRVEMPSGVVLSLTSVDERTMICSRGANDGLTSEWIDPDLLVDVDHLHLSGYVFLSDAQLGAAREAIRLAVERRATISVDPPPANLLAKRGVDRWLSEMEHVSWLFPNRSEGAVLTGTKNPETMVDRLAERFAAGALTLGPDGAIAWWGTARDRCAATPVSGIEPTGAGDSFAAAFVTVLAAGGSLSDANRSGCSVAAAYLAGKRTALDSADPASIL